VRNRIKRWVREAYRRHPELRPGAGDPRRPYDVVITAKRDVGEFSWQSVHDELVQQLTRFLEQRGGRSRTPGPPPRKPRPSGGRDGTDPPDKA
jgi:RNase P protein component